MMNKKELKGLLESTKELQRETRNLMRRYKLQTKIMNVQTNLIEKLFNKSSVTTKLEVDPDLAEIENLMEQLNVLLEVKTNDE